MPARRHSDLVAALIDAVLKSPGRLSMERHADFAGEPNAAASGVFAEKVRRHAYTVTDGDLDGFSCRRVGRVGGPPWRTR